MQLLNNKRVVFGTLSVFALCIVVGGTLALGVFLSGSLYAYPGSTRLPFSECPPINEFLLADKSLVISSVFFSCYVSNAPSSEIHDWYNNLNGWQAGFSPMWDASTRYYFGPMTFITVKQINLFPPPNIEGIEIVILTGFSLRIEYP
jgi:hypothetical protein